MMKRKDSLTFRADKLIYAFITALFALAQGVQNVSAQQSGGSPGPATVPEISAAPATVTAHGYASAIPPEKRYLIGPGDVLDIRTISVRFSPELSRDNVLVENDGTIRIPMIEDEVQAACLTAKGLSVKIRELYKRYKNDPYVDVFVKEYNSQPVTVVGAVVKPGQFQLRRRVRLQEVLNSVGGASERAGGRIQLVRAGGSFNCNAADAASQTYAAPDIANTVFFFSLKDTLKGEEPSNPYLQPGDVINLPEAEQAYVVGNVLRPGSVPLKEPVTVSMAVAMSGGTMPDTKSHRVRIIRQTPGNNAKTEIYVDLKAINERNAPDIALQPNDIIDVPTSGSKRLLRTLAGAVVPTIGQLPVQVIR